MSSHTSPSVRPTSGRGLGRSSGGVDSAFADRVRLYLKVTAIINGSMTALAFVLWFAELDPNAEVGGPSLILQASVLTGVNVLGWMFASRARITTRQALLTQGLMTLGINFFYAYVVFRPGNEVEPLSLTFLVLIITIVLVLRSSLVPSPNFASATVALVSFGGLFAFASQHADAIPLPVYIWSAMSCVIVAGVTVLTSHVIYGMEREMLAMSRLGQYKLERLIGAGSMGEVYLAKHALLHRATAVKMLRDSSTAAARERFRHEVQIVSTLSHPNTIEIYDYGRTSNGVFYFAMEYIEGATLDAIVSATGPMPASRVAHFLHQAAQSLREAHDHGLIHRDIKPANIMICTRGGIFDTLKVLDFGLVQEASETGRGSAAALVGTPTYLAPEAIVDTQAFSVASDLYALGATAYFLLKGRPPFWRGDLVEILSDHLATEPERLELSDPALEELILACLAKDPKDRPADAEELLSALEACASFAEWSKADARVWWSEHQEIIDAQNERIAEKKELEYESRRERPKWCQKAHSHPPAQLAR